VQKTETPGPGNYRLPSEFGYYEAAKFFKDSSVQSTTEAAVKTLP